MDDFKEGPVPVRKKVYKAAMLVGPLSHYAGMDADFYIPEILRDACRKTDREDLTNFGDDVYQFLYTMKGVGKDTHIDICPDEE